MTFISREEYERLLWQQHTSEPPHVGPLLVNSEALFAAGELIGALEAHYALITIADHLGHRTWFEGPVSGCGCGFKVTYNWDDDRGEEKADDAIRRHLLLVAADALVEHENIRTDVVNALLQLVEPATKAPLKDMLASLAAAMLPNC